MLRTIKTIQGYDISSFGKRFTVFVMGEELCFDTMEQAEHFITSGAAKAMEFYEESE